MNPTEQRNHTRKTDELAKELAELDQATTDHMMVINRCLTEQAVAQAQTKLLLESKISEQSVSLRQYVDVYRNAEHERLTEFMHMSRWQRFRWIVGF